MKISTARGVWLAAGLLVVAAGYSSVSLAQSSSTDLEGGSAKTDEKSDEWIFTLGGGVGTAPDYEGGDDYEAVLFPVARAQKGYRFAELFGLHATSNFLNHPHWRLGPSYNFRPAYDDDVDNDRVEKLTDRSVSHELGAKGGYEFHLQNDRTIELAFEVLADVSSGHEGFLFTPSVDFGTPLGKEWELGLGAEVTYASGDYMSHFFGINERESQNSGLDNFDADADFKSGAVNLKVGYAVTRKWRLLAIGEYKRMLGDAEDSPIVDDEGDEHQWFGGMAVTYSW